MRLKTFVLFAAFSFFGLSNKVSAKDYKPLAFGVHLGNVNIFSDDLRGPETTARFGCNIRWVSYRKINLETGVGASFGVNYDFFRNHIPGFAFDTLIPYFSLDFGEKDRWQVYFPAGVGVGTYHTLTKKFIVGLAVQSGVGFRKKIKNSWAYFEMKWLMGMGREIEFVYPEVGLEF